MKTTTETQQAVAASAETDERRGIPSASGLERICLCPGSWQAEQLCSPEPESSDAAYGTRLHAYLEQGTLPQDAEEAEAVTWCRQMESEFSEDLLGKGFTTIREARMFDTEGMFSGKPDYIAINGDSAFIADYKFGRVAVEEAASNIQLAAYAVLLKDNNPQIARVYACILQPFCSRQRPAVTVYGNDEFSAAKHYIATAIKAAAEEEASLKPGEKQCRYCRAKATCPAVMSRTLTCKSVKRWELLSLEKRAELWKHAQLARKMADSIERHIKADLKAEIEIPGLTLAPGRKMITVTDAQKAFSILSKECGVTGEEFAACCKVNISAVDKLFHAKRKETDPSAKTKDSASVLREILADCTETKVSDGSIKEVK